MHFYIKNTLDKARQAHEKILFFFLIVLRSRKIEKNAFTTSSQHVLIVKPTIIRCSGEYHTQRVPACYKMHNFQCFLRYFIDYSHSLKMQVL